MLAARSPSWSNINNIQLLTNFGTAVPNPNSQLLLDEFLAFDKNGNELPEPVPTGLAVIGGETSSSKF